MREGKKEGFGDATHVLFLVLGASLCKNSCLCVSRICASRICAIKICISKLV